MQNAIFGKNILLFCWHFCCLTIVHNHIFLSDEFVFFIYFYLFYLYFPFQWDFNFSIQPLLYFIYTYCQKCVHLICIICWFVILNDTFYLYFLFYFSLFTVILKNSSWPSTGRAPPVEKLLFWTEFFDHFFLFRVRF